MKTVKSMVAISIALPIVCLISFVLLYATTAGLMIPQLPSWARKGVQEWMLDHPQEGYDVTGWDGESWMPYSGWQIPRDGYDGDKSFLCDLPIEYGYITDYYGVDRGEYAHSGIDYGTYYGSQPLQALMGGVVTSASYSTVGYGELIVIENAGVQMYLAHNEELLVSEGDIVEAGDIIAMSGRTGNSTGYHVHMEFRVWDEKTQYWTPIDPNELLVPGQTDYCDWNSLQNLK